MNTPRASHAASHRDATGAARKRARGRAGVTLFEVLIASGILAMIGVMIYTAFDHTARVRTRLGGRQERDHVARVALSKLSRDLRSAFLSAHVNTNTSLTSRVTAFVGRDSSPGDRLELTTFTHRRLMRGVHEGDACEVGYRVEARRGGDSTAYDLLRRESPRIDTDPQRGGLLDVLVPDVVGFDLRYYDPTTDQWIDSWDTTQATGQAGRLPSRVKITLTLREPEAADPSQRERRYSTITPVMITEALRFGLPIF